MGKGFFVVVEKMVHRISCYNYNIDNAIVGEVPSLQPWKSKSVPLESLG